MSIEIQFQASGFSGFSGSGSLGSGTSGISGYSGTSGTSGYSGVSGYSGEGFSGPSGMSGTSGYSGTSGTSGTSGYSGVSGIGLSGVSGTSGSGGGTSADTLCWFTVLSNQAPAASFATLDTRNSHQVLDFDDSTDESAIFGGILPRRYGGGGITVTLVWLATSATSSNVVWDVAIERHEVDITDLDSDSFAAVQSATATTASGSGEPQYTEISFTNGAQMDSLAAGESFRIKVTRDANNVSDLMVGDAELLRVEIRETP